jgi:hypothetical protein
MSVSDVNKLAEKIAEAIVQSREEYLSAYALERDKARMKEHVRECLTALSKHYPSLVKNKDKSLSELALEDINIPDEEHYKALKGLFFLHLYDRVLDGYCTDKYRREVYEQVMKDGLEAYIGVTLDNYIPSAVMLGVMKAVENFTADYEKFVAGKGLSCSSFDRCLFDCAVLNSRAPRCVLPQGFIRREVFLDALSDLPDSFRKGGERSKIGALVSRYLPVEDAGVDFVGAENAVADWLAENKNAVIFRTKEEVYEDLPVEEKEFYAGPVNRENILKLIKDWERIEIDRDSSAPCVTVYLKDGTVISLYPFAEDTAKALLKKVREERQELLAPFYSFATELGIPIRTPETYLLDAPGCAAKDYTPSEILAGLHYAGYVDSGRLFKEITGRDYVPLLNPEEERKSYWKRMVEEEIKELKKLSAQKEKFCSPDI